MGYRGPQAPPPIGETHSRAGAREGTRGTGMDRGGRVREGKESRTAIYPPPPVTNRFPSEPLGPPGPPENPRGERSCGSGVAVLGYGRGLYYRVYYDNTSVIPMGSPSGSLPTPAPPLRPAPYSPYPRSTVFLRARACRPEYSKVCIPGGTRGKGDRGYIAVLLSFPSRTLYPVLRYPTRYLQGNTPGCGPVTPIQYCTNRGGPSRAQGLPVLLVYRGSTGGKGK